MTLIFLLSIIICLTALAIASYCDIRTREVPDWLSYGLIIIGIGIRLIFSLASYKWSFIIDGLLGFALFFAVACIMFYSGQWGGGDSKVLMGIGAVMGLSHKIFYDFSADLIINSFPAAFLTNTLLAGALYGIIWIIVLAIKNRKKFVEEYAKLRTKKIRAIRNILIGLLAATFAGIFFLAPLEKILLIIFFVSITFIFYFWLFSRAIEKSSMIKEVSPEKLAEGDWIVNDVVVNGKTICGPKDLGIEKEQILELIKLKKKKKITTILVKEGIPFVPSFLLGFIITIVAGNLISLII